MAKDARRCCPNCYNVEPFGSLFGTKGDGLCSVCKGEGYYTDLSNTTASFLSLGFVDTPTPCKTCNTTGHCQTCGGTGYEYYNLPTNPSASSKTENENPTFVPTTSASDNENWHIESVVRLVLIAGSIIIFLKLIGVDISGCESKHRQSNVPQKSSPVVEEETKRCQVENVGYCTFRNRTSRTIYLFISTAVSTKTLEIEPNQTIDNYPLSAVSQEYEYVYDYYRASQFHGNEQRGRIFIEQCSFQILDLALAKADWYLIHANQGEEISIPTDQQYIIVAPYRTFLVRFGNEERNYTTGSYGVIPYGINKIVVMNPSQTEDMEISIQKYNP